MVEDFKTIIVEKLRYYANEIENDLMTVTAYGINFSTNEKNGSDARSNLYITVEYAPVSEPEPVPTMSIYSPPGTKVRFLDQNGLDGDREYARVYLTTTDTYVVNHIEIGNWTSRVYLDEYPTRGFNTVMFETVVD